jgi:hypothetical protein
MKVIVKIFIHIRHYRVGVGATFEAAMRSRNRIKVFEFITIYIVAYTGNGSEPELHQNDAAPRRW